MSENKKYNSPQNNSQNEKSSEDEPLILESDEGLEEVVLLEEEKQETPNEILVLDEEDLKTSSEEEIVLLEEEESIKSPSPQTQGIEKPESLVKEFEEYITKDVTPPKEEVKVEEKPKFNITELKKKIISLEGSGDLYKVKELLKDLLEISPEDEWAKFKLSDVNKQITATCDAIINKLKGLLSTGKFEEIEMELSQVPTVIREEKGFLDFQETYEFIKNSAGFQKQGKVRKAIKYYSKALEQIEGLLWVQEQLANCIILLKTKRKKYRRFWIIFSIILLILGGGVFGANFYYFEEELYFFIGLGGIASAVFLFLFGLITSTFIGSVKPQDSVTIPKPEQK